MAPRQLCDAKCGILQAEIWLDVDLRQHAAKSDASFKACLTYHIFELLLADLCYYKRM